MFRHKCSILLHIAVAISGKWKIKLRIYCFLYMISPTVLLLHYGPCCTCGRLKTQQTTHSRWRKWQIYSHIGVSWKFLFVLSFWTVYLWSQNLIAGQVNTPSIPLLPTLPVQEHCGSNCSNTDHKLVLRSVPVSVGQVAYIWERGITHLGTWYTSSMCVPTSLTWRLRCQGIQGPHTLTHVDCSSP